MRSKHFLNFAFKSFKSIGIQEVRFVGAGFRALLISSFVSSSAVSKDFLVDFGSSCEPAGEGDSTGQLAPRRSSPGNVLEDFNMRLGNAFLQGVHTVCAHPVKTNLFVKTNRYNHLPNMFGR